MSIQSLLGLVQRSILISLFATFKIVFH